MSTDAKVTKDLIQTLRDGEDGFAKVAEQMESSDTPEIGPTMRRLSDQRAQFRTELDELAREYGDDADESGSTVAALHRGWISLKDAMTGSSPTSVLKAAETGEEHAVSEYDKALESDVSDTLRAVIDRQRRDIVAARDEVKALVAQQS